MQTATRTGLVILAAIGLAACDSPAEPFAFDNTFTSFADIETAFQGPTDALVDADGTLEVADDAISGSSDFIAAGLGSAIYDGAIIAQEQDLPADLEDGGTLIGQLQMEVSFGTNTIEARAGNFIHSADGALAGTLLGNGGFVRDAVENPADSGFFDAQIDGLALTGALSGENGESYAANIGLTGYFLNGGDPIENIAGVADVDFGADGPVFEEGAFAVSR